MDLALAAADLEPLDQAQKDAVLTALFVALIADGVPEASEVTKFSTAIATLPWGQPLEQLQVKMRAVQARLADATIADKIALLDETAVQIPAALRPRVVETMVVIASADNQLTRGEKGSIASFVRAFGLTDEQIRALQERFSPPATRN